MQEAAAGRAHKQAGAEPGQQRSLLGKDPTTATDFLPDRERQKKEEELRRQLEEEFKLRQQVCGGVGRCGPARVSASDCCLTAT